MVEYDTHIGCKSPWKNGNGGGGIRTHNHATTNRKYIAVRVPTRTTVFVLCPFELHPHEGNKIMTSFGVEPKIKVISFHLHAGHLLYEVTKMQDSIHGVL